MDSPFAHLLLALQERIGQLVTDIRWIDQDMGQLEHYAERPPVAWPCVLIDLDGWTFTNLGQQAQTAEGDVVVRLAFAPMSYANQLSPVKELALRYYETEFQLHKALHGWGPAGFASLTRLSADTEKRNDAIRVRIIRYHTAFEDYSTLPVTTSQSRPLAELNI